MCWAVSQSPVCAESGPDRSWRGQLQDYEGTIYLRTQPPDLIKKIKNPNQYLRYSIFFHVSVNNLYCPYNLYTIFFYKKVLKKTQKID